MIRAWVAQWQSACLVGFWIPIQKHGKHEVEGSIPSPGYASSQCVCWYIKLAIHTVWAFCAYNWSALSTGKNWARILIMIGGVLDLIDIISRSKSYWNFTEIGKHFIISKG